MQLSHGVWGSPFKHLPTACAKTDSSLLRESMYNHLCYVGFFPNNIKAKDGLYKLLQDNFFVNKKTFALALVLIAGFRARLAGLNLGYPENRTLKPRKAS